MEREVPMTSERTLVRVVGGLWALTLILHAAGTFVRTGALWGADLYRFLPSGAFVAGFVLAAGAGIFLARPIPWRRPAVPAGTRAGGTMPGRIRIALGAAVLVASVALFWGLRIRHLLLGDAFIVVNTLGSGAALHPREPLTVLLHQAFWSVLRPWFGSGPEGIARTVALTSALCGGFFVLLSPALARELVRSHRGEGEPEWGGPGACLAAAVLLAQGTAQLFFGYVENYTYAFVAVGLYLFLSLRFLRGRAPLWQPATALVVGLLLHVSFALLAPSFLLLAAVGLKHPARRRGAIRDLAGAALVLGGLLWLPALTGAESSGTGMLGRVVRETLRGHGTGGGLAYLFSGRHLRDFLNEQFLIGPLGLFLFLPAAAAALFPRSARRSWRGGAEEAPVLFLLIAAGGVLAGTWVAGDPALGYARDWDVFAFSGLVFTAAGLGLLLRPGGPPFEPSSPRLRGALATALAISLFHTVPWILVNASEARAVERMKALPLGYGRAQMVVGRYYLERRMYPEAEEWLEKSLEEFPLNVNAWHLLGSMHLERGDWAEAAGAYGRAIRLRPDRVDFHVLIATALLNEDKPGEADEHLRFALSRKPGDADVWSRRGLALLMLGEADSSRAAFERALRLAPDPAAMAGEIAASCRRTADQEERKGNADAARTAREQARAFEQR